MNTTEQYLAKLAAMGISDLLDEFSRLVVVREAIYDREELIDDDWAHEETDECECSSKLGMIRTEIGKRVTNGDRLDSPEQEKAYRAAARRLYVDASNEIAIDDDARFSDARPGHVWVGAWVRVDEGDLQ